MPYKSVNWTKLDFSVTEDVDYETDERKYAYVAQMREYTFDELTEVQQCAVKSVDGIEFCCDKQLCGERFAVCFNRSDSFSDDEVDEQIGFIDYQKKGVCMDCGIFVTISGHVTKCPVARLGLGGRVKPFATKICQEVRGKETVVGKFERVVAGGEVVKDVLYGFDYNTVKEVGQTKSETVTKHLEDVSKGNLRHAVCSRCGFFVVYKDHDERCKKKQIVPEAERLREIDKVSRVGFSAVNYHLSVFWISVNSDCPTVGGDDFKEFILKFEEVQYLLRKYDLAPDRSAKAFKVGCCIEYVENIQFRRSFLKWFIEKRGIKYHDCFHHLISSDNILNNVHERM